MKKTNMIRKASITVMFLMLIVGLGSCVKGDKGDPGPTGANGTNGTNGAANIDDHTITVHSTGWTTSGNGFYYNTANIDAITANVISNGTVQVFFESNTNQWAALPTTVYSSPTVSLSYGFQITTGTIEFYIQNLTGSTLTFSGDLVFKVVIIPSEERKRNPNTDWNNYNEIHALSTSEVNKQAY